VPAVVFLLIPRLHLLDLAGPAQVFSTAADLGYGYALHYVAERPDVPTAQGLTVRAAQDWPGLGPDDMIMVPGGRGTRFADTMLAGGGPLGQASLGRLAGHYANGGTVASVCAGADALGRAGLLDGRRCTTHHDLQDELARRYPRATVIKDVLYVVDGRVVTSAGIASGIDLGLHLIAARHGPAAAARVAREMVVYARRNGDEPQARTAAAGPPRHGLRGERADAHPAVRAGHRADAAALPAAAAGGAGRAPDRARCHGGSGRAGRGIPGRPDAAQAACPGLGSAGPDLTGQGVARHGQGWVGRGGLSVTLRRSGCRA